jgi:dihydropteroate synthase
MGSPAPLMDPDRTLIMGVVNVTPDSFSDGGRHASADAAVRHAAELLEAGADFVDVGGESTRPGAEPVAEDEELRRVLPVVEALASRGLGPVSIDTYKANVARAAVERGAVLVNDISGGCFEPHILGVVAQSGVAVVLSHARGRPTDMQRGRWRYDGGVVASVRAFFVEALARARGAGVETRRVLLDPGIGFGKTVNENLELLRGLEGLRVEGCPLLVGTSRKSFIGRLTEREVDHREFGTAATVALSIASGADMVRVHDVEAMRDVVRVSDAWVRARGVENGT